MRSVLHLAAAVAATLSLAAPALAQPGAVTTAQAPADGFRAALDAGDGTLLLIPAATASAERPLRLHQARATGGRGAIAVVGGVTLHDPDRHLPFAITHQFTHERTLTEADLDLRSIQRAPDGTLWLGDALGPFLIHVDATGRVLEAPVAVPDPDQPGRDLRSPDHPAFEETASLRLMNALRAHAKAHGATRPPIFAPYAYVLADGTPGTVSPLRVLPGSPSSEVHDVARLQASGHAVIPWTVNDLAEMKALLRLGVRGLISDRPDLLREAVAGFDADGDGRGGDYLDADGLIDRSRFDAQGHRGARNLRPESSLPAFEAALDHHMTTLETDCAITKDGVPILHHDPDISPVLVRRFDNRPVHGAVHHQTLQALQAEHELGRLLPLLPSQRHDLALSPVSVAFAREHGLRGPYAWPTLKQAFQFVGFYARYYREGAGRHHPDAKRRALNAARVHFDVETKTSPGLERAGITPKAEAFVKAVGDVVRASGMEDRTMIQSFDMRTLLAVHQAYPRIQTMLLLGEAAPFGTRPLDRPAPETAGPETFWAGAAAWPHRQTHREHPPRSPREGGLAALAIAPDGRTLYPVLRRPLVGSGPEVPILSFDLATRRFGAPQGRYRLEPGATSVPDFVLTGTDSGLAVERGAAGEPAQVFHVNFGAPGDWVKKAPVTDLAGLTAPDGPNVAPAAGAAGLSRGYALEGGPTLRRLFLMTGPVSDRAPERPFIEIELKKTE